MRAMVATVDTLHQIATVRSMSDLSPEYRQKQMAKMQIGLGSEPKGEQGEQRSA